MKKLVKKIRFAYTNKILSMAIVVEKEIYTDTISIRTHSIGNTSIQALEDLF